MDLGNRRRPARWLLAVLLFQPLAAGSADKSEYFEKKIRPLLAEHCYACHSSVVSLNFVYDNRQFLFQKGDCHATRTQTSSLDSQ